MAKKPMEPKPPAPSAEETFVELMLVASDYAKSAGGVEAAKSALESAGAFIARAGGVEQALKALDVLDHLKARIGAG